jgi:hypothetical protein
MSQEHVDLLRLLEDRTNRGQMSQMSDMEIRSFFHPDVEFLPLRAATEGLITGSRASRGSSLTTRLSSRSSSRTKSFSIWTSGCSRGAQSV